MGHLPFFGLLFVTPFAVVGALELVRVMARALLARRLEE